MWLVPIVVNLSADPVVSKEKEELRKASPEGRTKHEKQR
jgi:hypothetical protein